MSEVSVSEAAPVTSKKMGPSAKAGATSKKAKNVPAHPKVSDMVTTAITDLKERGGSSLQAIKKNIASNYKVDVDRLSPFIKKYLKSAVASGTLVQTKGKGATGSFKLGGGQKTKETKPAASVPKVKKAVSSAPSSAKKDTPKSSTKTPSSAKKLSRPKSAKASEKKIKKKTPVKKQVTPKKSSKAKTPKKVVKVTKPKSPKPKKAPKKASVAKKPAKK